MINGVHAVIFSQDAEGARALFQDALGFRSVDAGGGWLIFALPPAELAVHPTVDESHHELYFMCDDVNATVAELTDKGVEFAHPVREEGFRAPDSDQATGRRGARPLRAKARESIVMKHVRGPAVASV